MSNALTMCGACHRKWHDEPLEGATWLMTQEPSHQYNYEKVEGTWHEDDFLMVEKYLIYHAIEFGVRPENINQRFRIRFERKVK
jgi:hypothetical protein